MEIMEDTNSNSQVSLNNNIIYVVLLVVTMNHVFYVAGPMLAR